VRAQYSVGGQSLFVLHPVSAFVVLPASSFVLHPASSTALGGAGSGVGAVVEV
jgi:hypothetical protein